MDAVERFDRYLEHLSQALKHADRHAGLRGYCTGLMLPLARKSVEPMAARLDPLHASARHQALHHFVAKAHWCDVQLLRQVAQWVVPRMDFSQGGWWIIDDTGFPKKGRHSVGVARQYCGQLGKQDNCQVAVSVSLSNAQGSLPLAWRLYLPKDWAGDAQRRHKAGVPDSIEFATKPQIALAQLRALLAQGAPRHPVLADAGYGVDHAFRQALTDMGLPYMVGVTSTVTLWPAQAAPRLPKPRGWVPVMYRDTRKPMSARDLALALSPDALRLIEWRQGTNEALRGRFAAMRVHYAGATVSRASLQPEQWLLVEWPPDEAEPSRYYLSTLPEDTPLDKLVDSAHRRWRIERDYQDLKQDCGLGHYEGRGWRGFHHHASLSIAAYGFLMAERLMAEHTSGDKKNFILQVPAVSQDYVPRGSAARATARSNFDHEFAP